jgi:hypothetical protein
MAVGHHAFQAPASRLLGQRQALGLQLMAGGIVPDGFRFSGVGAALPARQQSRCLQQARQVRQRDIEF